MIKPPGTIDATATALFLDVDGTLLRIRDNPADVEADRALVELLHACYSKLGGALALVSGRSIAEVDRIFAPFAFPVAGAHGAELRGTGDNADNRQQTALPEQAFDAIHKFAANSAGLLVEKKQGGASLHYRQAPQLEAECRHFVEKLLADLGDSYRLIAGKMVFEIAPADHNKGAAICTFMGQSPFTGRAPVFIGDDVTDEDGFRVVNELGGVSIRVGEASDSAARNQLADEAAVRAWLGDAILGWRPDDNNGEQQP